MKLVCTRVVDEIGVTVDWRPLSGGFLDRCCVVLSCLLLRWTVSMSAADCLDDVLTESAVQSSCALVVGSC